MKCPVCDSSLVEEGNVAEDGTQKCPKNHYGYTHSYGSHEEWVGDGAGFLYANFGWHYTETAESRQARYKALTAFVEYLKMFGIGKQ